MHGKYIYHIYVYTKIIYISTILHKLDQAVFSQSRLLHDGTSAAT